jgi:hypothetical protein
VDLVRLAHDMAQGGFMNAGLVIRGDLLVKLKVSAFVLVL